MNHKLKRTLILPAALLSTGLFLTGCAAESTLGNGSAGSVQNQPNNSTVDRSEATLGYASIIDVRTLEEWNDGHLEGAVRIGIESPDFINNIETLDKTKNYYIYCRSGNRAEQAIQIMRESGFTGVLENGGAVENAAAELNLPIVK